MKPKNTKTVLPGASFSRSQEIPNIVQNENSSGGTFRPSRDSLELTNEFLESRRRLKKYDGDNDFLDCFTAAVRLMASNKQDFSWSDFLVLTRRYDDGDGEVTTAMRPLFADWIQFLRLNKKIVSETGAYEWPMHRWI
jgi:hypothetical protein